MSRTRISNTVIYKSKFMDEVSDWSIDKGEINMNNSELIVTATSIAQLTAVDLREYESYLIEFELYNYYDNRIDIGTSGLLLRQDINTTLFYIFSTQRNSVPTYLNVDPTYTYEYNLFNETEQWKEISFAVDRHKTIVTFSDSKKEFNIKSRGKHFYLRKWNSGFIKARNLRITAINYISCQFKPNYCSFLISLYIMIMSFR